MNIRITYSHKKGDANGNPGQHQEPVSGFDEPMTKAEALHDIEQRRPGEDFRYDTRLRPAHRIGFIDPDAHEIDEDFGNR